MSRPRESAVIVPISLPPALERLRLACVPVGLLGVPAHVTLLYPFIPPDRIRVRDLAGLRRALRAEPAFAIELSAVGTFPADAGRPGTTYLVPVPAGPLVRLTRAIWAAFPDHPPYGGAFDAIVPHLTVADDAARLAEVEGIARTALPVRRRVSDAWLIVEGDDDRWTRRARLALGPSSMSRGGPAPR